MRRFSLGMRALISAFVFVLIVGLWQANAQSIANQAKFNEAVAAYEAGDYLIAFKTWLPLAYEDDPAAQRNLGHLYRMGLGVKQDFAKAADWYRKAAELGLARAQANLANMYLRGQGVERDAAEAGRWFSAAAEQGHIISQYNLGLIYEHGLGTDANDVEAVKWYYLASKGGHAKALSKLALLISKNAPPELARLITGQEKSTELAEKAPAAVVAPSTNPRPVTHAAAANPTAQKPSGTSSSSAVPQAADANGTPATHSAALPPKQAAQELAQLPTPKLPPAGASSAGASEAANSSVRPGEQTGGILSTLKTIFGSSQNQKSAQDLATADRESVAVVDNAPSPPDGTDRSNTKPTEVAAVAAAVSPPAQPSPVEPVPVVPVSSILDAGLIAYRARDYRTALTNWLPLAQQGNDNARFFIGGLYADGAGVPRDVVRAHVWWSLAAASGHSTAVQFLENLKLEMEPDQIIAASLLAKNFGGTEQ